jgi:hypothetical protein
MSIGELLAIYTSQTMGNTSLPRFSTFSSNGMEIASFFGGEAHKDMAILLLNEDEDPKRFEDKLIVFYHHIINGEIDPASLESRFQELFSIVQQNQQQTQVQFHSMETRFDAYLELFKDLIELLDTRMTKLENNILKLTTLLTAK